MAVAPLVITTDGKPAVQFENMKEDGYQDMQGCLPLAGGFHKALEAYKLVGKQHADTVLNALLHPTARKTDGRKKWILSPDDPNNCSTQLRELIYALHVAIVQECIDDKIQRQVTNAADLSPAELETYMLERCSVCPAAITVLLWQRDVCTIHWLEDMERDGDHDNAFEEYRILLPLLQRIHVLNNATNYTPMVAFEMLCCKLEFPGMIRYMARFVCTCWTAGGKRQWGDRFVENLVRACRSLLGNTATKGMAKKIAGVVRNLRDICLAKIGFLLDCPATDDEEQVGGKTTSHRVRGVKVTKGVKFFNSKVFKAGTGEIVPFKAEGGDLAWRSKRGEIAVARDSFVAWTVACWTRATSTPTTLQTRGPCSMTKQRFAVTTSFGPTSQDSPRPSRSRPAKNKRHGTSNFRPTSGTSTVQK